MGCRWGLFEAAAHKPPPPLLLFWCMYMCVADTPCLPSFFPIPSAPLPLPLLCLSGTPELPSGYNPATWMLEVTGGSMATLVKVRGQGGRSLEVWGTGRLVRGAGLW